MLEIILSTKAEAERELLLAQAKIEVCDTLMRKFEEKLAEKEEPEKEAEVTEVCEVDDDQTNSYLNL